MDREYRVPLPAPHESRTLRIWAGALCLLASGCTTTRFSDTSRTATEQILLAQTIDAAVEPLVFEAISGSTAFIDTSHLGDRVDRDYVVLAVRRALARYAVHVLPEPEKSEFLVVLGIGVTGTDRQDTLIGLPSTAIGGMWGGPAAFATPEIALYKRIQQEAACRITATVVETASGQLVQDLDSGIAVAQRDLRWHLGVGPHEH